MKMREASEREANGAEKTEENRERERERAFNLSRISFIQLHELHFFA
jgi:hypothetical protein